MGDHKPGVHPEVAPRHVVKQAAPKLSATRHAPPPKADEKKLDSYLSSVKTTVLLSPQGLSTLSKITQRDRQILAIWGYMRYPSLGRGSVNDNWAWDAEQIKAYDKSSEHTTAARAVRDVIAEFSKQPGMKDYHLSGKADPRSIERQIKSWNENATVQASGKALHQKLLVELAKAEYTDPPDAASIQRFQNLLAHDWASGAITEPTNATPGLSPHGQNRAVDFHVYKGKEEVVGANRKQTGKWRDDGFAGALQKSIDAVNTAAGRTVFKGPLANPDEPWHYSFIPVTH